MHKMCTHVFTAQEQLSAIDCKHKELFCWPVMHCCHLKTEFILTLTVEWIDFDSHLLASNNIRRRYGRIKLAPHPKHRRKIYKVVLSYSCKAGDITEVSALISIDFSEINTWFMIFVQDTKRTVKLLIHTIRVFFFFCIKPQLCGVISEVIAFSLVSPTYHRFDLGKKKVHFILVVIPLFICAQCEPSVTQPRHCGGLFVKQDIGVC